MSIKSFLITLALCAAVGLPYLWSDASADPLTQDLSKVVGPDAGENNCATCHALEVEAWQRTRHFATFKDRHRSDRAKEILANIGEKSMKRSGQCYSCHYTNVLSKGKTRAKWGVSCESCHNPGKDWVNSHYKKNGDPSAASLKWGMGKKGESDADRNKRLMASQAHGMINSDMLYHIAANCYGCHTVPNEMLVNKGKHTAGSKFDLVEWSQGEIRHNFVSSAGAPDNATNRKSTPEEKRRMYVVGNLVDLEFSVRNLISVKEKGGDFHKSMIERVNAARSRLEAIVKASPIAEVTEALSAIPAAVDASSALTVTVADKLKKAGMSFSKNYDGSKLAALDSLISKSVKGTAHKE